MDDYQDYLSEELFGRPGSIKRFAYRMLKRSSYSYKFYCRLINWPVRKLGEIPNVRIADRILDVGVGTGFILSYIREFINKDAELFGVDLSSNKSLPSYINFYTCNIEQEPLPFEDESFDIVISTYVIEHLTKPWSLFKEAYRVLKKGGCFYCVTEHVTSLFMPDYWNFYQDRTHIKPYTKRSLGILLKMARFKKLKVGLIRAWEYVPLIPLVPILNIISTSNFSFVPFEILGRTVYCIGTKDEDSSH